MSEKSTMRMSLKEIRAKSSDTDWRRLKSEEPSAQDDDFALDWERAVLVPPRKKLVSIRLDADVLEFFRSEGRGYQTRMNAVLRHYMETAKRSITD